MMESSFIGGHESMQFGVAEPLKIFDEPEPTTVDYFKPTIDSVSNFIKNIVLSAKMEREIPIMAAAYLETFLTKSRMPFTSINYKRYPIPNSDSWYQSCSWLPRYGTTSLSRLLHSRRLSLNTQQFY